MSKKTDNNQGNSYLRVWHEKFNTGECKADIDKIVSAVHDDKDGLLFLVRRYGLINVYYLGTVILDYNGKTFSFNKKYLEHLPAEAVGHFPKNGVFNDFDSWYSKINDMKCAMEKCNMSSRNKREKRAQQAIVHAVNNNSKSKYYILDIEYDYPGITFGRFDMIAVSKEAVHGKHKIAIIELKWGTKSFRGTATKSNEFGSGIVGHAYNLYCYINGKENEARSTVKKRHEDLAKELASMTTVCHKLKLAPAAYLPELRETDFDINNIQTWFLSVGCNPKTAEEGVLRYMGYPSSNRKNSPNIRDNVSLDMKLRYKVIREVCIDYLDDSDFRDPTGV